MEQVLELLGELADRNIRLAVEDGQLACYAPKGSVSAELAERITRLKPRLVDALARGGALADVEPRRFPLSVGESSHYLLQQLDPQHSAVVPICVTVTAPLDPALLQQAWDRVLDRYSILTTRIVEEEGTPFHSLDARCRSTVRREARAFADDAAVVAHFRAAAREPFDLHAGPLVRITLFDRADGGQGLFILLHHIVFDGYSVGVLLRALLSAYRDVAAGAPAPAPPAASGYEGFVGWEARMLASPQGARHAAFWKEQLRGELPGFRLLPDAPQPDSGEAVVDALLPRDVTEWVREFAKSRSLQPSALFLGAFQLLLHKYTGQQDLVVLMPVTVRPEPRFADEVGYFFNIVPIRARLEPSAALGDFLRRTQMTLLDAVFHSAYPFALITSPEKIEGSRDFGVYYAFHDFANLADAGFAALRDEFGLAPVEGFGRAVEGNFEIAFEVFAEGDAFRLRVQADPKLHSCATLRALVDHFHVLLREIGRDPTRALGGYPIATDADRRRAVVEWNATAAPFPRERCMHDFFLDQAAADPGRLAVVCGERRVSYGELEASTRALALHLQALGTGPDAIVALCVERSVEMMLGIHGIVRAGGAYMPIDPDYPDDRIGYMLQDSRAAVILTQERHADRLRAVAGPDATIIALDTQWSDVEVSARALAAAGRALRRDVQPHHLCYVIYTSGSTGRPKGVLVEHRALVNRIHWMQSAYGLTGADVVVQKTPYCFDVSVWEFFWPPMTGAALVFAAPRGHSDVHYLEHEINRTGVTTLHFVPSMLRAFLDNAKDRCPGVRLIFCSGEALDRGSVDRYRERFPNAALHNLYGPTEAAIDVTYYDCTKIAYPFVPIGAPIHNTQIYIVDAHGNPAPVGVPGELYIAGVNLARGYLNRPELTQERFVANPFEPGTRMYRTGDLARWLDDGNIQYLGRIDSQVKIGGVRIETGEIEAQLNRHPAIAESVVIARGPDGDKQLVAFYRARHSTADDVVRLPHQELRAHLLQALPEQMVPAAFVGVAAIPVTSNGKTDQRALAQLDVGLESSAEYVAPRTATEHELVAIWASVFKDKGFVPAQARIGVNDNFFELGGNSLLATQLLYRIRAQLGVELPVRALFDEVSIGRLAALVETLRGSKAAAGERAAADLVVTIESRGSRPPLFALPGIGGNVLTFRELSRALGPDQPFHAVQAPGLDGAPPPASVDATADATLAAIRTVQPQGPYRLLGHSYGGVVAYAITLRLLDAGEDVASLALLDSATPAVLYANGATDEFEDLRRLCVDIAAQGGTAFTASADALRGMPADALRDLLAAHGVVLDRAQFDRLHGVMRAARECYRVYGPRALPRPVDVRLYRATRSRPETWPADYGWGALVGKLQVADVDADHYSMLHGDVARGLAQRLAT